MFNTHPPYEFFEFENPSDCLYRGQLLINTATHEFGHAIGLLHVDPKSGQMMSPHGVRCSLDRVGLGTGDYSGYKHLYEIRDLYEPV